MSNALYKLFIVTRTSLYKATVHTSSVTIEKIAIQANVKTFVAVGQSIEVDYLHLLVDNNGHLTNSSVVTGIDGGNIVFSTSTIKSLHLTEDDAEKAFEEGTWQGSLEVLSMIGTEGLVVKSSS
ncbi:MAG: hypothetical protein M3Q63_00585 [bacterium]|nr:hypothetical protein [bacterium]